MLIITIDLYSAVTGKRKNLGTLMIANDGTGTNSRGNYYAHAFRAGTELKELRNKKPIRKSKILNYPRLTAPVWSLIAEALKGMGYGLKNKSEKQEKLVRS